MSNSPFVLQLSDEEHEQLAGRPRAHTNLYHRVVQMKIMLIAADGGDDTDLTARSCGSPQVVHQWLKRCFDKGSAGMQDHDDSRESRSADCFFRRGRRTSPKRFRHYAMAYFVGTALMATSMGAVTSPAWAESAGPQSSARVTTPFDNNPIEYMRHVIHTYPVPTTIPKRTASHGYGWDGPLFANQIHGKRYVGDVWACIRAHESGANYSQNTGNGYYGAYQFSQQSWQFVGGSGLPSNAPPAEQDYRARLLQQRRGWQQWPVTSRMCGQ